MSGAISVSVLFSEPKISQFRVVAVRRRRVAVSVLFSEPKISQSAVQTALAAVRQGFSALQRAENFSIGLVQRQGFCGSVFQCSSASRKFLNSYSSVTDIIELLGFSALQRAENFSIKRARLFISDNINRFSALQRAENFSIARQQPPRALSPAFQCSSASRKFLNRRGRILWSAGCGFQCSSASRKFLNRCASSRNACAGRRVSVLFSEPKISQSHILLIPRAPRLQFQCSSASRKFLNPDPRTCIHPYSRPR